MFLKRGDPGRGLTVDYYAKDGGPGTVLFLHSFYHDLLRT